MNFDINPFLIADFYKTGHPFDYPDKTEYVYSNMTARNSRMPGVDHMVVFGIQYFLQAYLVENFRKNFFDRPRAEVLNEYKEFMACTAGDLPSYDHIAYIYDMNYLPIHIKCLPEGSLVPMRVPFLTVVNTESKCGWLTNFIETLLSTVIWQPCCSATIAHEYRRLLNYWANLTGMPAEFVQWQGHDFSMRGMSSLESATTSGMAHLTSFTGTDTIPAIFALKKFYDADYTEMLVGSSVPATEHAVMCAGGKTSELETIRRQVTKVTPGGIKAVVSDTWDLWNVLTVILPQLKDEIMARTPDKFGNAKVVIRPDSGDPVKILCGSAYPVTGLDDATLGDAWDRGFRLVRLDNALTASPGYYHIYEDMGVEGQYHYHIVDEVTPAMKGVIELLWEVFGGTTTSKGYKLLDSHIGAIYGDSITLQRANSICALLAAKGFASQCVFGIGSFTYQYNTRDTFGMAMKATFVVIDGQDFPIFKDPVTDDGVKKSAVGLLRVRKEDGDFVLDENVTSAEEQEGELRSVFLNGQIENRQNLDTIRHRLTLARS